MLQLASGFGYYARHAAMFAGSGIVHRGIRRATLKTPEPDAKVVRALLRRFYALMKTDRANVAAGFYPASMLDAPSLRDTSRLGLEVLRDLPRVLKRREQNAWREVTVPDDGMVYPAYYRRTFHWQSDGYFSVDSADRYAASVEFLFGGTANMMRRQVLPPIAKWMSATGCTEPRMLDVACGAGEALSLLAQAFPQASLHGIDLSSAYLQRAKDKVPSALLSHANAESMPYADASFDVVCCVYLFHELPTKVRRTVVAEMLRVLKPGGLLVIEDSAQHSESADIGFALERFSDEFHEPFFAQYLGDPLENLVVEVGGSQVTRVTTQAQLVSKVVSSLKA